MAHECAGGRAERGRAHSLSWFHLPTRFSIHARTTEEECSASTVGEAAPCACAHWRRRPFLILTCTLASTPPPSSWPHSGHHPHLRLSPTTLALSTIIRRACSSPPPLVRSHPSSPVTRWQPRRAISNRERRSSRPLSRPQSERDSCSDHQSPRRSESAQNAESDDAAWSHDSLTQGKRDDATSPCLCLSWHRARSCAARCWARMTHGEQQKQELL